MHHRATAPQDEAPQTAGKLIHWARWYDLATWLMSFGSASAIRRKTVELAEAAAGEAALDVGCGTGTLALKVTEKVGPSGQVVGIDASPEMIDVARRKAARTRAGTSFEMAAIEDLPFPDNRFDLALSTLMLHHLPPDLKRRGLAEVNRVLKPGGRLLLVDLAGRSYTLIRRIIGMLHRHVVGSSAEELVDLLQEAGFGDVELVPTGFKELAFVRGKKGAQTQS